MKNKILVITTRSISENNTIFESARRCDTTNEYLSKYLLVYINSFIDGNTIITGAPKVLQAFWEKSNAQKTEINEAPQPGAAINDKKATLNDEVLREIQSRVEKVFPQETIEIINSNINDNEWLGCIKEKSGEYKDSALEEEKKKEIDQLLALVKPHLQLVRTDTKEQGHTDIKMDYSDLDDYLDYKAVNIDKNPADFTIRDRVSLYSVLSEVLPDVPDESGNEEKYIVYAAWPLGNQDNSSEDENGDLSSNWVDTLTDAVIAESKVAPYETEIILLLHDNDLRSTVKTPFRTVYANKEYRGCKRSLAVYQHSNTFFHKIINHKGKVKDVVSNAEKIIIDDWKVYYLKELSHLLASYKGEGDKDSLETKYKAIREVFNIDASGNEFLSSVSALIRDPEKPELLFAANLEVNEMIKELRYKEKNGHQRK